MLVPLNFSGFLGGGWPLLFAGYVLFLIMVMNLVVQNMSEPITSNSLPPDNSVSDSSLIIVALYRLEEGETFDFKGSRMPLEYITLDFDIVNRHRAHQAAMNLLESHRAPGRFVIRIGEGHQDGEWPVFEKVHDTINFRSGGVGI